MPLSVAELRVERARLQIRLYDLAPAVGLHPTHLGAMLSGRRVMPDVIALKVADALAAARRSIERDSVPA
jgi:hypothetical protein